MFLINAFTSIFFLYDKENNSSLRLRLESSCLSTLKEVWMRWQFESRKLNIERDSLWSISRVLRIFIKLYITQSVYHISFSFVVLISSSRHTRTFQLSANISIKKSDMRKIWRSYGYFIWNLSEWKT